MKNLSGHYIICGAGRVGSRVVGELERSGTPFVVIERERELVQALIDADRHVIVGDATLESTLRDAGVARARGLAACLPNDPDNVYVVLTARGMNADLHIVARAVEEQAEAKLIRAGASRVIAPIIIGGHRMAQALTKPAVSDFVDSLSGENRSLNFEEVLIAHGSVFAGKKLHQSNIGADLKVAVIAIRRPAGDLIYHPDGEIELNAGDLLVAIGRPDSMERMMKLAAGGTE